MARQYTCGKCGGQGHGRDDCGKSRVPSISRQSPLALLPHPDDPSPGPKIDDTYSAFLISQGYSPALSDHLPLSYREDDDFIAPAGDEIALAESDNSLPKELNIVARNLISSLGMDKDSDNILTTVVQSLGLNRDTRIAPADEAATSLAALHPIDGTVGNKTIENVRSGKFLLTYSELAILRGVKDEVDARQQLSYLSPLDSEGEWIPTVEQRRCTICGQFVGVLGSHNCSSAAWGALGSRKATKEQGVKITLYNEAGGAEEQEVFFRGIKGISDVPDEELQDIYLATYQNSENLAGKIVMGFYEKPFLGMGQGRISLPAKLRAAVIECPSPRVRLDVLAEMIDPPFEKHEIARILDSCSMTGCEELLSSPKARGDVVYALSNSPTSVGLQLSTRGRLPQEVLSSMASCGDQAVRRQAAVAPNLGLAEAEMLSTDPDPDVRAALLYGSQYETPYTSATSFATRLLNSGVNRHPAHSSHGLYGRPIGGMFWSNVTQYPHLLNNYVNDPDEGLAMGALSNFPYSRHSLQAIGQITSRKRLETIDKNLDTLWPYLNSSDDTPQHTLGHVSGVDDLVNPELVEYRFRSLKSRTGMDRSEAEEGRRQTKRLIAARLGD